MKKSAGFTLMEMIIVMVILGIVASIAAPLIFNAARASALEYDFANTISQGQNASTQMTLALRNLNNIDTMTASSLSFTDNSGNSVSYSLSNGNLLQDNNTLAQNATNLSFAYYNSNLSSTASPDDVRYISYTFVINNDNQSHTFTNTVYLRSN